MNTNIRKKCTIGKKRKILLSLRIEGKNHRDMRVNVAMNYKLMN